MSVVERDGVTIDVCTDCHGVWFDHHEIAAIWRMERDAAVRRRQAQGADAGTTTDVAAYALVDSLFYAPDLVFLGAHAAGRAVAASAEVAGGAPEALGAAAEVAAEAAEGVFSTILEIIGGIFG
jgi:hypothetical protein